MATKKTPKDKKPKDPAKQSQRIQTRIDYLKRTEPKSKEIAQLQKKLTGLGGPSIGQPDANGITPESQAAADTTKRIMEDANNAGRDLANEYVPEGTFGSVATGITPEMQAYLDRINEFAKTAGNYTENETLGIDGLKSGLGGYLAPELQAMREQRLREMDGEVATQTRQSQLAAARSGTRGPYAAAAVNNLGQQAIQTRGDMEQDLFARNADVVQQRKEAFSNIVNQTETARFARKQGAEVAYGNVLGGEENVQRALEQFNLSQKSNEALARSGTALGGAGVYSGLYGTQYGLDAATKNATDARADSDRNFSLLRDQIKQQREALAKSTNRVGV